MIGRRELILAGAALALTGARRPRRAPASHSTPLPPPATGPTPTSIPRPGGIARGDFGALQASLGPGGRLGVAAYDTGGERWIVYDENSRYAMCSTAKLPLAAAIWAGARQHRWAMNDEVRIGEADLLDFAPTVRANLARGHMTLDELCEAALRFSDNAACNLLLNRIGGPAGWTAFARSCGDRVSRLDRTEPMLNENAPGDPRDTTTPLAMANLCAAIIDRKVTGPGLDWLMAYIGRAQTGLDRLRAGLPPGWEVGDKTGTGANGAYNDVAIAMPPGRNPIVIAAFVSGGTADAAARAAVMAGVGRSVAATFSSFGPFRA